MKHFASQNFWRLYKKLPKATRGLADKNFELLKDDPKHPSLHFKKAGKYWSARVGSGCRALAVEVDGNMIWFWIGSHSEYNMLIRNT